MRSRADIEDLVQEASSRIGSGLAQFEFRDSRRFRAWILSIAQSVVEDQRARDEASRRDIRRDVSLDDPNQSHHEPTIGERPGDDPVVVREFVRALEQAIARLEPRLRRVAEQHYLNGLSMRDLSRTEGVSLSQVYRRHAEATAQLSMMLSEWRDWGR